jgi:hypothetical protein
MTKEDLSARKWSRTSPNGAKPCLGLPAPTMAAASTIFGHQCPWVSERPTHSFGMQSTKRRGHFVPTNSPSYSSTMRRRQEIACGFPGLADASARRPSWNRLDHLTPTKTEATRKASDSLEPKADCLRFVERFRVVVRNMSSEALNVDCRDLHPLRTEAHPSRWRYLPRLRLLGAHGVGVLLGASCSLRRRNAGSKRRRTKKGTVDIQ